MADDDHYELGKIGTFNATPGENYAARCAPTPAWRDHEFLQRGAGGAPVPIPHNAHHILCVAAVNDSILDVDPPVQQYIRDCCEKTTWTINNNNNLIALPLWGHTIFWYVLRGRTKAPPFKDFPQHDREHNGNKSYLKEVQEKLAKLWKTLHADRPNHKSPAKSLASDLKTLEDHFREEIEDRGKRHLGGTHAAWEDGADSPNGQWYLSFSMAKKSWAKKRKFLYERDRKKRALSALNRITGR